MVAILETGRRTATYKLATLMALIEHCIENMPEHPDDALAVEIPALARRVLGSTGSRFGRSTGTTCASRHSSGANTGVPPS